MNVLDEFKNYKRKFIQISHRTAILMHIFEKSDDDFEDIILSDHEEYYKQNHNINIYKEAADQFFKQFVCIFSCKFCYLVKIDIEYCGKLCGY